MTSQRNQTPKVFISYSHDSQEQTDRVLALSNQLRADGIDCHIDQYETPPLEGWPRWMVNQIEAADFVLVVCTDNYERRFSGKEAQGMGLGVKWEGAVITQRIYEYESHGAKFIPVLFSLEDSAYIPLVLRSTTWHRLDTREGYENLYRRITDQPHIIKPALGNINVLPSLERKQLFEASVKAQTEESKKEESQPIQDHSSLVLLTSPEGTPAFIKSEEIEIGDTIKLTLVLEDSRDTAFLESLRRAETKFVGVAFGNRADLTHVKGVKLIRKDGKEKCLLELNPKVTDYRGGSGLGEMALGDYSPDKIAEMRARRILLDERVLNPRLSEGETISNLNDAMLEVFVQGINTLVKVEQSPLPTLYTISKDNIYNFLAYARLLAVLWLRISGVVEHIYRLDMRMQSDMALFVDFEGRRARTYVNVEPPVISVRGTCQLVIDQAP